MRMYFTFDVCILLHETCVFFCTCDMSHWAPWSASSRRYLFMWCHNLCYITHLTSLMSHIWTWHDSLGVPCGWWRCHLSHPLVPSYKYTYRIAILAVFWCHHPHPHPHPHPHQHAQDIDIHRWLCMGYAAYDSSHVTYHTHITSKTNICERRRSCKLISISVAWGW